MTFDDYMALDAEEKMAVRLNALAQVIATSRGVAVTGGMPDVTEAPVDYPTADESAGTRPMVREAGEREPQPFDDGDRPSGAVPTAGDE